MAHYAQIGTDNIVTNVIVVNNEDVWVQTSYNSNFRKNYAGIGYTYDTDRDAFYAPQPYPSWTLNESTCKWECPEPYPNDGIYNWNEDTLSWVEK